MYLFYWILHASEKELALTQKLRQISREVCWVKSVWFYKLFYSNSIYVELCTLRYSCQSPGGDNHSWVDYDTAIWWKIHKVQFLYNMKIKEKNLSQACYGGAYLQPQLPESLR